MEHPKFIRGHSGVVLSIQGFQDLPEIALPLMVFHIKDIFHYSVDSRNFKKWGRSPTTTQNVGEGLKIMGDDFMMKFKQIKNTFSVYLDIFNWASIN